MKDETKHKKSKKSRDKSRDLDKGKDRSKSKESEKPRHTVTVEPTPAAVIEKHEPPPPPPVAVVEPLVSHPPAHRQSEASHEHEHESPPHPSPPHPSPPRPSHTDHDAAPPPVAAAAAAAEEPTPHPHVEETTAPVEEEQQQQQHVEMMATGVALVSTTVAAAHVVVEDTRTHQKGFLKYDEDLSHLLAIYSGTASGHGKPIAKMVARAGKPSCFIIWLLVMILASDQSHLREQLCNLYIGVVISSTLVLILRATFRREKPHFSTSSSSPHSSSAQDVLERYSFPSGSASSFALSACFVVVNYNFNPTIVLAFGMFVVVAGLVTITLGRHYVLDIVCGWMLGIALFLLVRYVVWVPSVQCDNFVKAIRSVLHL